MPARKLRNKFYSWDVIIRLKAQELASFILGKRTELCFNEPKPILLDDSSLREAILSLTAADAMKRGLRRNTLWYARKRVNSQKPLKVYQKVKTKIL